MLREDGSVDSSGKVAGITRRVFGHGVTEKGGYPISVGYVVEFASSRDRYNISPIRGFHQLQRYMTQFPSSLNILCPGSRLVGGEGPGLEFLLATRDRTTSNVEPRCIRDPLSGSGAKNNHEASFHLSNDAFLHRTF